MKLNFKIFGTIALAAAGLSGLAAAGPAALKALAPEQIAFPEPATTVCGIMVRNDAWGGDQSNAGVYTFEVAPEGAITCLHSSYAMASTAAALLHNGQMYAVEVDYDGYFYRTYNASTWATIGTPEEIDVQNVPSDLTYDPVTGKVYGGFYDEDYGGFSRFASFGLTTAEASDIKGNMDERDFIAIAATPDGTIYALHATYNYLIKVDPRTGNETKIGRTGLGCEVNMSIGIVSSMTWDEDNSRLIAIVADNTGSRINPVYKSALYTIDPTDTYKEGNSTMVRVTKVRDLPGNPSVAGLHIVEQSASAEAPAGPSDLRVEFTSPASLTGAVCFKAPLLSNGGQTLSGSLLAQVSINGNVVATLGDITPGSEVRTQALTFPAGESTVRVVMASPELRGEKAELTVFAGEDSPATVGNATLDITPEGWASICWTAPEAGANGGNIVPANLRYNVVRVPDKALVASGISACSFLDKTLDPAAMRTVSYTVTALNDAGQSAPVETNSCLSAGALSVPFTEGFDTQDDFDLWQKINNNPGGAWKYSTAEPRYAYYKYADDDKINPADNWLISPAIRLYAGKAYKLSYSWRANNKNYPESFEIHCGTAPTQMGAPLASHIKVANTSWQTASTMILPESDGLYYIGVHAVSDPYMYLLYIDDIAIEEIDNHVPARIDDLTVTPADRGALEAAVSFTVPSKDNEGGALSEVSGVRLYRRGASQPLKTFTGVHPGDKLSYTDKDITAAGLVGYSAVAYNAVGEGVPADAEAFVGVDVPGAPADVHISEVNGHLHLEWQAPLKGANGGWFDPAGVTYRIVRSDGTVVAEACPETSFTDMSISSPKDSQLAFWYLITPYSGSAKGAYAQSETLLFGAPYKTPVAETFAGADMLFYPWIAQSSTAVNYAWTLDNMGYNPQTADQNGDQGLATFHSVGEPVGSTAWFFSPKFTLAGLENPVLTFWVYRSSTTGDEKLDVYIAAESDTFEPAGLSVARQAEENGWERFSLSLEPYASKAWIRVGFMGTGAGVEDMYLDNVAISSRVRFDAAVTAFKAPARIGADISFTAQVAVENMGSEPLADLTVSVRDASGTELASASVAALAADAAAVVDVLLPGLPVGNAALTASVAAASDTNAANNSATATVKVVAPVLPTVTGLTGAASDGALVLSWNAPSARGAVTDNFEDYKDFAISGVGEWTMWDADFDNTYMINTTYGNYPDCTSPKAFQVINAEVLGINQWAQGTPHSGKKMMAALCCQFYVNNDWLISPRLNGAGQWISFWARSFSISETIPAERMRVFYSTSDNDPANFVELTSNYVQLPDSWVEYRYWLPEGARYFAINCVSDGAFAMFVDDVCFNDLTVPAWTLTGYEVFRNGVSIGTTSGESFTDPAPEDKASYTVRPVYSEGNGALSDAFVAELSGLAGELKVEDAPAEYYNLQGIRVDRPENGFFIRYQNGSAVKEKH
ncbi:MAG: choice-of-anchor J domain-containing protein [Muribaculaceae bacterium]|nr:choice-of-anchor J domain-containing protein [Muribaculaceae bacterium]